MSSSHLWIKFWGKGYLLLVADLFLLEIRIVSFNVPLKGWAFCNGQLLPINQNRALFSLLCMDVSAAR
jgi:hypothetical protein